MSAIVVTDKDKETSCVGSIVYDQDNEHAQIALIIKTVAECNDDSLKEADDRNDMPDCWKTEQFQHYRRLYPWIKAASGLLGCNVCSKVSSICADKERGCHLTVQ